MRGRPNKLISCSSPKQDWGSLGLENPGFTLLVRSQQAVQVGGGQGSYSCMLETTLSDGAVKQTSSKKGLQEKDDNCDCHKLHSCKSSREVIFAIISSARLLASLPGSLFTTPFGAALSIIYIPNWQIESNSSQKRTATNQPAYPATYSTFPSPSQVEHGKIGLTTHRSVMHQPTQEPWDTWCQCSWRSQPE